MGIEERVSKYLDAMESMADKAGNFVADQTPLVAQEFLLWEFWSAIFAAIGFVFVAAAIIAASRWVWNRRPEYVKGGLDNDPYWLVGCLAIAVFLSNFIFLVAAVNRATRAVKVRVAPRVVLLETVRDFVRGTKK